jgi:hypothetical protein
MNRKKGWIKSENSKSEVRNPNGLARDARTFLDLSRVPSSPASSAISSFRISDFEFRI